MESAALWRRRRRRRRSWSAGYRSRKRSIIHSSSLDWFEPIDSPLSLPLRHPHSHLCLQKRRTVIGWSQGFLFLKNMHFRQSSVDPSTDLCTHHFKHSGIIRAIARQGIELCVKMCKLAFFRKRCRNFPAESKTLNTLPHASLTDSQSWNQCTLHISFASVSPLHARVPVSVFIMYSPLQSVRGARFLNAIRSSGTVHAPRFAVMSVTSKAREKEKQQEGDGTKREAKDYSSKKKIPHRLSPRRGERSSAVLQRVKRSSSSGQ